jgi:L-ascorbate metabolism protein UlaG (beta-lactamase superfamily)
MNMGNCDRTNPQPEALQVTYLGSASILLDYAGATILIDGFFSRPTFLKALTSRLQPDKEKIRKIIESLRIKKLQAVIVSHSHYDHALDAAEIARQTGAQVVGSLSTANISRGWRLPEKQIHILEPYDLVRIDPFQFRFIPSRHAVPLFFPGQITRPLVFPTPIAAFREGGTYAIHIVCPAIQCAFIGSSGYRYQMFQGIKVDILFLSVAGLEYLRRSQLKRFFEETVGRSGARLVVPIHWDNFFQPNILAVPTFSGWFVNTHTAIHRIQSLCREANIDCFVPRPFEPFQTSFEVK